MKLVLPREHGSWGMLFAPLLIGMIAGGMRPVHVLLFLGMLAAFLAANPLLQWMKKPQKNQSLIKWAAGYGLAACAFGLPLLFLYPKLLAVLLAVAVLLLVNIRYARRKNERALLNDAAAISGLSLGGVAAYFIGERSFDLTSWLIALTCLLQFFGAALHVKTITRARDSRTMKRAANGFHLLLLVLPVAASLMFPQLYPCAWLSLAFAGSALRTWLTPLNPSLRIMTVGIIEVFNTLWFVAVASLVFR